MAPSSLHEVVERLRRGSVVALTGAGCSTASGIPDYRGINGILVRGHRPISYQEFCSSENARRRYWARSHAGWPRLSTAVPNSAHRSLTDLEQRGVVRAVITQNVDGLHQAAGTDNVVDLHGRLHTVVCLTCGRMEDRNRLHDRLSERNTAFAVSEFSDRPDGDVEIDDRLIDDFTPVTCRYCDGVLKPDVVFFGEAVPALRVERARKLVQESSLLLVLGSSLSVYSGRRFVAVAKKHGIPVVIINLGKTRSDDEASIRLQADVSRVLPDLVSLLDGD